MSLLSPLRLSPLHEAQTPDTIKTLDSSSRSLYFSGTAPESDPKPKWRLKNLKYAALALLGTLGFWSGTDWVKDFHQWSEQTVASQLAKVTFDSNAVPSITQAKKISPTLEQIARIDQFYQNEIPILPALEPYYLFLLQWDLLFLGLGAIGSAKRKTIRPKEIFKELNNSGIRGQGEKVGIVDSGILPTKILPKSKFTFYQPNQLNTPSEAQDPIGHGTAVANIIADANPDSEFVAISYKIKEQEKKIVKELNTLLNKAADNPEILNLTEVRKIFKPMISNIANGVRKCVDEGCSVINVSLSVEQAVQMTILTHMATKVISLGVRTLFTPKETKETAQYKAESKELKAYIKKLNQLREANFKSETLTTEIKSLYQEWYDVLDYANSKNATVVLAAGNAGGYENEASNTIGNSSLLGIVKHPALFVVGSTDYEGNISDFSSEYNADIHPHHAANGSGQLSTRSKKQKRKFLSKLISPMAGISKGLQLTKNELLNRAYYLLTQSNAIELPKDLKSQIATGFRLQMKYENPKGTSFAAPDSSSVMIKIKQVWKSIVGKAITNKQLALIIEDTVKDSGFSDKQLKKLHKEVSDRLANRDFNNQAVSLEDFQTELLGEAKRRIGYGTLSGQRNKAVNHTAEIAIKLMQAQN